MKIKEFYLYIKEFNYKDFFIEKTKIFFAPLKNIPFFFIMLVIAIILAIIETQFWGI